MHASRKTTKKSKNSPWPITTVLNNIVMLLMSTKIVKSIVLLCLERPSTTSCTTSRTVALKHLMMAQCLHKTFHDPSDRVLPKVFSLVATNILNAIVVVLNGGPTHSKFGLTYFSSLEVDDEKILGVSLDHSNEGRVRTLKDEKRSFTREFKSLYVFRKHASKRISGPLLAPVVRRLDNAIHRINHYPADKC